MTDFSFAFQPIVDVDRAAVWAYEALVRGPNGEPAPTVLEAFTGDELYRFAGELQIEALRTAARLGYRGKLSINALNGTLRQDPDSMRRALDAAVELGFDSTDLVFEVSEKDQIDNVDEFAVWIRPGRTGGSDFALDDFGAGYSGLNLLASFQPNYIKLDMSLIRDIWRNGPRQAIVRGVCRTCLDLGIEIVAEGIEDPREYEWLFGTGVRLFQGYLFGRPGFEAFPEPSYPPF